MTNSNTEKDPAVIQMGLHELTTRLVQDFIQRASSNKSFFVNEIQGQFPLKVNQQMLVSVLSGLLSAVVTHSKNSCIRLSAKIYGNVVLVQVKDSTAFNTGAIENEVSQLQPIAEKMLGSIIINTYRKNRTTITFAFPNLPLKD